MNEGDGCVFTYIAPCRLPSDTLRVSVNVSKLLPVTRNLHSDGACCFNDYDFNDFD